MVRVYVLVGGLAALMASSSAKTADLPMLSVAQRPGFDWSGWRVGGHVGYAAGWSDWSASKPAGGSSGTGDLTSGFDLFKGSGSFFGGLQGGYNVVLPSRFMLGVETD